MVSIGSDLVGLRLARSAGPLDLRGFVVNDLADQWAREEVAAAGPEQTVRQLTDVISWAVLRLDPASAEDRKTRAAAHRRPQNRGPAAGPPRGSGRLTG